ncbi:hypothetical protein ACFQV2_34990 [Actinokineospora soli]|uniref:Uncharacterized protein n=1 Tax=Actinokineospora soli TaxID=1048753 RepID=A0ABW2TVS6_9PSEU
MSRVRGNDQGGVSARVRFKPKDGGESEEGYVFRVIQDEKGVLKIDSFRQGSGD